MRSTYHAFSCAKYPSEAFISDSSQRGDNRVMSSNTESTNYSSSCFCSGVCVHIGGEVEL